MIRVKICGVTTPEDGRTAADAGADALGLNFYPKSPRYVSPQAAVPIVRAVPAFTAIAGVFVEMPIRQICAIAYQLGLRAIQTYSAGLPTEDVFPFAHVPAFRIQDAATLEDIRSVVAKSRTVGRPPAAVLLDAYVEGSPGGTGRTPPWELLAGFDPGVPVILAGGLTPENVAEAIHLVRPWGVDVASGVESAPGRKDPDRVRAFVAAARAAAVG